MKGDLFLLGGAAAAMLAVPLAVSLWAGGTALPQPVINASIGSTTSSSSVSAVAPPSASGAFGTQSSIPADVPQSTPQPLSGERYAPRIDRLRVLDVPTGKVEELTLAEFLPGAIAAETPPVYHLEALKAQGVATLTATVRETLRRRAAGQTADVDADFAIARGWLTPELAREKFGDNHDYHMARLTQAADDALERILTYDGEPILAAYHAISSGVTENSANVWSGALPYLVEVDSQWDILAAGYRSDPVFTAAQLAEAMELEAASLPDDPSLWLEVLSRSAAGYVTAVRCCGVELSGQELRTRLELRSSAFEPVVSGRTLTLAVKGYGHGVGLSQNGADYLARQGWSCERILAHYYPGATITPFSAG